MRTLKLIIIIALYLTGNLSQAQRLVKNINEGWLFFKGESQFALSQNTDEKDWEPVNIPHTWNADDSFDHRGVDDGLDIMYYYYRGPGWYRKWLEIPEKAEDVRYQLFFEAANATAQLYVNGELVGKHTGGYSGFTFDITPFLKYNDINLVSVRVDNSYNYDIPPQRADYTMYGGIYRDVYLIKTKSAFIGEMLVRTIDVSAESAGVELITSIDNKYDLADFSIRYTLFDPEGKKIKSGTAKIEGEDDQLKSVFQFGNVETPRLWSPDNPVRYKMTAELILDGKVIDKLSSKFGFRYFRFDAQKGFILNGEHLRLKGVNRHQDRAGFGWALSNAQHLEDIQMIKSMGANFVRLAHYQQDQSVLNACDSLGMLVWEEIPVVTSVGREKFKENAMSMLREMITQHYNHPSIVVWGLMNETERTQPLDDLHWNYELCVALNKLAKSLDPTRYTTQAQMRDLGTGILKVTDIRGWNRYFGWYYDKFEDFGKFMDEQKALDPDQLTLISEYGAGSKRGYHKENPDPSDFTEEWQVMYHRATLNQIEERPWIAGACVWNMFSFASEEKQGNIKHINQKGLVTWDRKPKDVFYFYQSRWSDKPMVYIVSHTWLERKGREGEMKKIEVFSNCESVELFMNGKSLGSRTDEFIWQAAFESGENSIRAVGKNGKTETVDEIKIYYTVEQ